MTTQPDVHDLLRKLVAEIDNTPVDDMDLPTLPAVRLFLDSLEQGPPDLDSVDPNLGKPGVVHDEVLAAVGKRLGLEINPSITSRLDSLEARMDALEITATEIDEKMTIAALRYDEQDASVERIEKVLRGLLGLLRQLPEEGNYVGLTDLIAMLAHPSNKEETDGPALP